MKFDIFNLVVAIVSIAVGILISRHFSSRRRLAWTVTRRRVLDPVGGKFPSNVKVFFDDHEVKGLTEWRFGLWNSGNRAITHQEFVDNGAVTLKLADHKVLKTTEPSTSRSGVLRSVEHGLDCVTIKPELLDVEDAAAFTIYTTSDVTAGKKLKDVASLQGHILNLPKGVTFSTYSRSSTGNAQMIVLGVAFYGFVGFWAIKSGLKGLADPSSGDVYAGVLPYMPADLAWYLTVLVGLFIVLLGILFMLGVVVLSIGSSVEWLRRPPKFIQEAFESSDTRQHKSAFWRLRQVSFG